jgi:hypothetical protein
MKDYESPEFEIVKFTVTDIIATSDDLGLEEDMGDWA